MPPGVYETWDWCVSDDAFRWFEADKDGGRLGGMATSASCLKYWADQGTASPMNIHAQEAGSRFYLGWPLGLATALSWELGRSAAIRNRAHRFLL